MTETTIDRLARAAYEASDAPAIYGAWDSGPGPHQEHQRYWYNQVRAVLRELRDVPLPEYRAAAGPFHDVDAFTGTIANERARMVIRKHIDHILEGK